MISSSTPEGEGTAGSEVEILEMSSHGAKAPRPNEKALIETDNFDRVSKRSAERLYNPRGPQLYRDFVPKPQRRSLRINRLYWLRTTAIDSVVRKFIDGGQDGQRKIVVNLGCGSDTLPWRHQHREALNSRPPRVRWVDVDLADCARNKVTIITKSQRLSTLVQGAQCQIDEPQRYCFVGSRYSIIGCDMIGDLSFLQEQVSRIVGEGLQHEILFVAETSLSYQDPHAVEALLKWTKVDMNAQFCLLDYVCPAGKGHSFAGALLHDKARMGTPLRSIDLYQTIEQNNTRFQQLGWHSVKATDLWEVWNGADYLVTSDKDAVNALDSYRDWEDLLLLARHFFILHASHTSLPEKCDLRLAQRIPKPLNLSSRSESLKIPSRRHGGLISFSTPEGASMLLNIMGEGKTGLCDTCDIITMGKNTQMMDLETCGPDLRSHCTITDLGSFGILLVGGTAAGKTLRDAWIYGKGSKCGWEPQKPKMRLPVPLSHHGTVRLGQTGMALTMGGLSGSKVARECFLFHPYKGWRSCQTSGTPPEPVYGATLWCLNDELDRSSSGVFKGVLCGGMTEHGSLCQQAFKWYLDISEEQPNIQFRELVIAPQDLTSISLFGAAVKSIGRRNFICGGFGLWEDSVGQTLTEVQVIDNQLVVQNSYVVQGSADSPGPLMLGCSAEVYNDCLVVIGGGMSAFPTERLLSSDAHVITLPFSSAKNVDLLYVKHLASPKMVGQAAKTQHSHLSVDEDLQLVEIPRVRLKAASDFQRILQERKPVVIEFANFGKCLEMWTPEYMTEKVGIDTHVVVHEGVADSARMDFNSKNFRYVTEPFGAVMSKMKAGGRLYLRSLSKAQPSELPANLEDDFPGLAGDFVLPPELAHAHDNLFSSILRLSGRANMWLHYDVMANIYTQITGSKRMILFPPRSVTKLGFSAGASSSSLDVFSVLEQNPARLSGTEPHEANLKAGDALFLPAAWLHTAAPATDMSVAVNVFFRDLQSGYAEGRDVYGNRDLSAYEKGRQDIKRLAKMFKDVPPDLREFYMSRIADELSEMAVSGD